MRVRAWKSTISEKQAVMRERMKDSYSVTLVESGRGFSVLCSCLGPEDPVIILTCPEPRGREWLEERRAGKGRGALSDYWTPRRLDYECNGPLLNYVNKHLRPEQVHHFVITDRAADWPAVDECFGKLFRKLNNALLKGR